MAGKGIFKASKAKQDSIQNHRDIENKTENGHAEGQDIRNNKKETQNNVTDIQNNVDEIHINGKDIHNNVEGIQCNEKEIQNNEKDIRINEKDIRNNEKDILNNENDIHNNDKEEVVEVETEPLIGNGTCHFEVDESQWWLIRFGRAALKVYLPSIPLVGTVISSAISTGEDLLEAGVINSTKKGILSASKMIYIPVVLKYVNSTSTVLDVKYTHENQQDKPVIHVEVGVTGGQPNYMTFVSQALEYRDNVVDKACSYRVTQVLLVTADRSLACFDIVAKNQLKKVRSLRRLCRRLRRRGLKEAAQEELSLEPEAKTRKTRDDEEDCEEPREILSPRKRVGIIGRLLRYIVSSEKCELTLDLANGNHDSDQDNRSDERKRKLVLSVGNQSGDDSNSSDDSEYIEPHGNSDHDSLEYASDGSFDFSEALELNRSKNECLAKYSGLDYTATAQDSLCEILEGTSESESDGPEVATEA